LVLAAEAVLHTLTALLEVQALFLVTMVTEAGTAHTAVTAMVGLEVLVVVEVHQ
jgi:hypothetical protein